MTTQQTSPTNNQVAQLPETCKEHVKDMYTPNMLPEEERMALVLIVDEHERIFGRKSAWELLFSKIEELITLQQQAHKAERKETIMVLRILCKYFGDNDWDENLHLADIIDKHLGRHLYAQESLSPTQTETHTAQEREA